MAYCGSSSGESLRASILERPVADGLKLGGNLHHQNASSLYCIISHSHIEKPMANHMPTYTCKREREREREIREVGR